MKDIYIELLQEERTTVTISPDLLVVYGLCGTTEVIAGQKQFILQAGGVLAINPMEEYIISCSEKSIVLVLHITQEIIRVTEAQEQKNLSLYVNDDSSGKHEEYDEIRFYFASIFQMSTRAETIKSYIGVFASNVAGNPLYTLLTSFLLLFYTDYIGLPAAACGGVILVSKVMDGISDLIAGHIIDHTHTKRGSARPWILRAGIPLAFCYVILLAVPPIPQLGQLIYLFISYNLVNTVIYTMYACASTSLPTYMTADQQKRSTLFVVFILAGTTMVGIVGSSIMKLVIFFGDDQRAWLIAGCILGAITLICTLITYGLCKETVVINEDKKDHMSFLQGVKIVFTNKYWLIAAGLNFLSILLQTAIMGVGGYYAKYVMNDVELVGLLVFLFAIPCIPFLFLVPKMMKRWGKRNVFLVSMIVMLGGQLLMVVVPTHGSVYVSLIIRGIAYTITYSLINGLISDTIEWSEYKSGLRPQAMTMAVTSLSQKFGSGVGTALLSFYLTASGFDRDPFGASAVAAINNSFVYIPIIFIVLSIVLIFVYDLDKKYDRVVAENRARREQKQSEMIH